MNSSLVHYRKISPNRNSPRNKKIDTITIHCTAGMSTLQGLGDWFGKPSTGASCNYAVDTNGFVGCYVDENDRSWCSSSAANDHRAVTIEVVTEAKPPYSCSQAALKGLTDLCIDICKRNNIKKLLWTGNKKDAGNVAVNNVTVHRWFSNTDCPGDYLMQQIPYVVEKVNASLDEKYPPAKEGLYRVQLGAFKDRKNAENLVETLKKIGYDAFVVDGNG